MLHFSVTTKQEFQRIKRNIDHLSIQISFNVQTACLAKQNVQNERKIERKMWKTKIYKVDSLAREINSI